MESESRVCVKAFIGIIPPPSKINAWQLTSPLPTPDSKNANYLFVTELPPVCGYQVDYQQNAVTIPFTGCHVKSRVNCNVSVYARYWNTAGVLQLCGFSWKAAWWLQANNYTVELLYPDQRSELRALPAYCVVNGALAPRTSGQNAKCIQSNAPPLASNLESKTNLKWSFRFWLWFYFTLLIFIFFFRVFCSKRTGSEMWRCGNKCYRLQKAWMLSRFN